MVGHQNSCELVVHFIVALHSMDIDWGIHDFFYRDHLLSCPERKVAFQRSDPRFNRCCIELDWSILGAWLVFGALCQLQQNLWSFRGSCGIDAVVLYNGVSSTTWCRDELRTFAVAKETLYGISDRRKYQISNGASIGV